MTADDAHVDLVAARVTLHDLMDRIPTVLQNGMRFSTWTSQIWQAESAERRRRET